MAQAEQGSLASQYSKMETDREIYLNRARDCAKVTIPSLIPPSGASSSTVYPSPYQSMGARGVNNLASKLLLALFPPNSPFFRLLIDEFTVAELAQNEDALSKVEEALGKIERSIQTEIEASALRVPAFEALKHLVVAGNILAYLPPDKKGGLKLYRLDKYVIKRDPRGNVLKIITKEAVSPLTLPPEFTESLDRTDAEKKEGKPIDIYTIVKRTKVNWETWQEVKGKVVPETKATFPLDKTPWIPLRMIAVSGEDYGRSYVEEYLGDLISLEGLTKAIVQGSAAAAKVLFLINPNGTTRKKDLAETESGGFAVGSDADVSVLQLQKQADFQVAHQTIQDLKERLSYAFLLNTAIQRNAERVTAEEIRYMANELEDALGGVYSVLSQEFQLPIVTRIMFQMERAKKLPVLPTGTVKPTITTGLEALGRGHDLSKMNLFLQHLQPLGPEVLAQYLSVGDYIQRVATALGIPSEGLVKSDDQIMAEQQQAQQQQMMMQLASTGMATEATKQLGERLNANAEE